MKGNLEWRVTRQIVPYDEAVPKPSKDIIPVVRCKDCKYYDGFCCQNMKNERMMGMIVADDWFCADGERRVDIDERLQGL